MDLFFVFAKNVMYLFFFCIFGGGCLSNTWSNSLKTRNVDVAPIDISIAAGGQRGCIDGLPEDIALAVLVEGLLGLDPLGQGCCLLPTSERACILHGSNFLVQATELPVHPGLTLLSRVAPVAGVGAALLAELTGHGVVNPADTLGHRGIDTRCVVLATADTPGNDTSLDVGSWVKLALADKGASTISLAGVLAVNSASADKRIVQLEPLAKSGGPEGGLALVVADNWWVDLLENHLVVSSSSKLVLTPSCGKACLSIEELFWLRKTDGVNMSLKVKVLGCVENGPIVSEVPRVEFRMDIQVLDISVLMGPGLGLVLCVPFSTPDLQLCWFLLELGGTMGSSENDPRGNEGASTLVKVHGLGFASVAWILGHRLLSKNSAHVGPFAKLGLVLVEALDPNSKTVLVPLATLGYVLHNWRRGRGDEVRVKAADIKEPWALAVLGAQDAKAVPDVDEATSVGDDGAVVALVVRDTFVALGSCVVSAILKDVVNIRGCLVCESCSGLVVIRGHIPFFVLHHLNNCLNTIGSSF